MKLLNLGFRMVFLSQPCKTFSYTQVLLVNFVEFIVEKTLVV